MISLKKINSFKNKIAFITETNQKKSYLDFSRDIKLVDNLNIAKGSLIFLVASFSYDFVKLYFNFLNKKIIPFILNENLETDKINTLSKKYLPNYILSPENKNFKNFFKINEIGNYSVFKNKIIKKHKILNDTALLMSTSGSTGDSKFVMISKKNLKSNTESIIEYLKINHKDVCITTLPLSYSYGLSILNTHIYKGSLVVINKNSSFEKEFWKKFNYYKITSFSGVPFSFEILLKLGFLNKSFKYLRYFTVAGGAINTEILKKFNMYCIKNKKKFYCMYGQTEATTRMAYLPFEKISKKIGSIGIPIPGGKLKIIDVNGNTLEKNKIGEIFYEGKNVMIGYLNSLNDLTIKRSNNYKLRTGDLGYYDNDNFFYLTGRIKRILKVYGHRISIDEIQLLLLKNKIDNVCIEKNNKLIIFITEKEKFENQIKNLIFNSVKLNLNDSIKIIKINQIPINKNGKINYKKLYEYL